MCWYGFSRSSDMPPNGTAAVESNRPGTIGGTLAIRFRVDCYRPGTASPLRQRNLVILDYDFADPASPDPQDPVTKHVGLDFKSGCPGPWEAGEPIAADCWGVLNSADAVVWNEATQMWDAHPAKWLVNPSDGTLDFCDGQWHTLWITAEADIYPAEHPTYTHCRCWADGILVDEWWSEGNPVDKAVIGFEHSKEKIDASIDYCCFAYEPIALNGLAIADDTSPSYGGHQIGALKKSANTTIAGNGAQAYLASRYVNLVLEPGHIDEKPVYYIEEDDRQSGVLVQPNGNVVDWTGAPAQVSAGDRIDVYGAVMSPLGEKGIAAWKIVTCDPAANPETSANLRVGVTNLSVGGSYDGTELDNTGLLVTVWGKVTMVDFARGFFYLDDGTGWDDRSGVTNCSGDPVRGIRVVGYPLPSEGSYLRVNGVIGRGRYLVFEWAIDTCVPVVYMISMLLQ